MLSDMHWRNLQMAEGVGKTSNDWNNNNGASSWGQDDEIWAALRAAAFNGATNPVHSRMGST
jgi:hypothetical protein